MTSLLNNDGFRLTGIGIAVILFLASPTQALTIHADTSGIYRKSGDGSLDSATIDPNGTFMFVAWNPNAEGNEIRDFATFDLSVVPSNEIITGAELHIGLHDLGLSSPDPTETIEWVSTSTSAASLAAGVYSDAIWEDLGTGTSYGSRTVTAADNGTTLVSVLNADAVSAMNASLGGPFSLGGHLTSIDMTGPTQEALFFNGFGQPTELVLTTEVVPEPGTAGLLGLSLVLLSAVRRTARPRARPGVDR